MSERNYDEAWEYTMQILHDKYKTEKQENIFQLWFNMNYVEDTIDTITVSVASLFMQQSMQKRGTFDIVLNKLKEITGQDNISLKIIIVNQEKRNQIKLKKIQKNQLKRIQ